MAEPALHQVTKLRFRGSQDYWEKRYESNLDSGIGSYGELASFKATVLNRIARERQIQSVIEFGCGDGHQLSLATYNSYVGLDVAPGAIDRCMTRFSEDFSKSFFLYDPDRFVDRTNVFVADMSLSLDVIFHLVEDRVFDQYMRALFAAGRELVVIYSSNTEIPDPAPHVRHRNFTPWIEQCAPDWRLAETVMNPHKGVAGAVADFYIYEHRRVRLTRT